MDTALITDARQIMRSGSARPYPLTITLPLSALIPLRLKHCIVFTCTGFHLLMIQAVFSASGDNVLPALWEISVFRRDSLDLFRMSLLLSPSLFLSPLSFQIFLPLSTFLLSHISPYSPRHSLPFPLSHLSFSFFSPTASQRIARTPISLLHTLFTFRLSSPSPPPMTLSFIHINTR